MPNMRFHSRETSPQQFPLFSIILCFVPPPPSFIYYPFSIPNLLFNPPGVSVNYDVLKVWLRRWRRYPVTRSRISPFTLSSFHNLPSHLLPFAFKEARVLTLKPPCLRFKSFFIFGLFCLLVGYVHN